MIRPVRIVTYDDDHNKTVFHNTTSDLQDQDHSVRDQDWSFWSRAGLVVRPTVSDHITVSDRKGIQPVSNLAKGFILGVLQLYSTYAGVISCKIDWLNKRYK